ncbi:assimilatory sulfite reductase (NADPH) hemoprotein subunit [Salsuginibacillus kocurii]|uniref:assimilatory sulfite reductase (NADPH) hemoprotein subunit n=1 Tax=Salsuginibacillus kocurii TaxID=427078 RepID=UPI0003735BA8|nr:assimilatory sulfite reductase (NADPH) hemoprotein subunit [Salsuginibacillus kocurii]
MSNDTKSGETLPSHDEVEHIKRASRYLRGTLEETLNDPITGSIPDQDNKVLKFHGSYMQDDRDLRNERRQQKLEPDYQFMVRVLAPGGVATPEQWLVMDDLAHKYANGTLRLTTRQAFQLHGIVKPNLKNSIKEMNEALLSTLAACGDVNRNVMCTPNPYQSEEQEEVYEKAEQLKDHLAPKTPAYHEIWLDGEKLETEDTSEEVEPIYGPVYLPRKFKIGITVPPSNDVDVFSQDIGFIAIFENGKLQGFNVAVGGGLGMTHGDTNTYPQLGRIIGFCPADSLLEVAENIVTIQRDYGDREHRKQARLKYTIDRNGLDWFKAELHHRLGWELSEEKPYHFERNGDRYGWVKGTNNRWHLTLFIQNGRIKDDEDSQFMTGLREIARIHTGDFRITANQNVIISNITNYKKPKIQELVDMYGLTDGSTQSPLHKNSIACVAFPTCALAMAEAERYLPTLVDKLDLIIDDAGLQDKEITIRMSGCPNSCARPSLGEIGFIGKAPGKYNLYLGAGFAGDRLNKLYKENIGEQEILETLTPIINDYAKERSDGEHFGDFVIRKGYVKEVPSGEEFHV